MEFSWLICRSHQPSGRLTANSIAEQNQYRSVITPHWQAESRIGVTRKRASTERAVRVAEDYAREPILARS